MGLRHTRIGFATVLITLAACVLAPAAGAHGTEHGAAEQPAAAGVPITLTGTLEQLHGHAGRDRRPVGGWGLETRDGRRYGVRFDGVRAPSPRTQVRVHGRLRGNLVTVATVRRLGPVARAAATPAGLKKTAVVLFNFADDASQPFTAEQARAAVFTGARSVNAFYQEESYGKLALTGRDNPQGDVYGWVTIPSSKASCDVSRIMGWTKQAADAVAAQGVNLSSYDHVVYVHPTAACGWAGIATIGGGWSAFNGTLALWVAGHEIGHNYGLEHAGKAYCRSGSAPVAMLEDFSGCDLTKEYDDPYDIMGNREQRHASAVHQRQMGWLPASAVQTVTASGTFTLAPSNQLRPGAVQTIRIPRGDQLTSGGRTRALSYWLEYRRPAGAFDAFASTDAVVNGVTIRVAGPETNPGTTWLIDTTPHTAWYVKDEPLTAGRTFSDPSRGISIRTEAVGPEGAQVRVEIGASGPTAPESSPADVPAPAAPESPGEPEQDPSSGPGEDTPDEPRRVAPARARAQGRALDAGKLAKADGRAIRVRSRHGAAFDTRFATGAGRLTGARLELRVQAPRPCPVTVRLDTGRRLVSLGRLKARRAARTARLAVPSLVSRGKFDVRVTCARRELRADLATLLLR